MLSSSLRSRTSHTSASVVTAMKSPPPLAGSSVRAQMDSFSARGSAKRWSGARPREWFGRAASIVAVLAFLGGIFYPGLLLLASWTGSSTGLRTYQNGKVIGSTLTGRSSEARFMLRTFQNGKLRSAGTTIPCSAPHEAYPCVRLLASILLSLPRCQCADVPVHRAPFSNCANAPDLFALQYGRISTGYTCPRPLSNSGVNTSAQIPFQLIV